MYSHYADYGGLEYSGKLGPEVELGQLKGGASFYKNCSSGDSGVKVELNLVVIGVEGDSHLESSMHGYQPTQWSFSFFGFQRDSAAEWSFSPSKTFGKGGLQMFAGVEVSLNPNKVKAQRKKNEACGFN